MINSSLLTCIYFFPSPLIYLESEVDFTEADKVNAEVRRVQHLCTAAPCSKSSFFVFLVPFCEIRFGLSGSLFPERSAHPGARWTKRKRDRRLLMLAEVNVDLLPFAPFVTDLLAIRADQTQVFAGLGFPG